MAELEVLRAAWDRASDGERVVVVLEGPGGIGKSALVRQFVSGLDDDTEIFHASAAEEEQHLPFGLADQLLGTLGAEPHHAPDTKPFELGAGLVASISQPAARAPVVVVCEDLQWSDHQSLLAVLFALRRLTSDAVLAVLSSRPPIPEPLKRLAESTFGQHLSLEGLTTAEVRGLVEATACVRLSLAAAERLRAHTDGLPLHLRALCAELEPEILQRSDMALPAPRSMVPLLARRLAACSNDAAGLVRAVAVLDGRCCLRSAAEVAAVDDPASALAEAVAKGFLVELPTGAGCDVQSAHPVIRAAVLEDLGADVRRRLHERAACVSDTDTALRHRAAAAIGCDDDLADETEAHATGFVRQQRLGPAAEALLRAAALSCDGASAQVRLLRAVDLMLVDGDAAGAAVHRSAVESFDESATQHLVLAQLAYLGGRQHEVRTHSERGWLLSDPTTPVAARLAILRAQLALLEARSDDAVVWAERASIATEDTALCSVAQSLIAMGEATSGRHDAALARIEGTCAPGDTSPEALLARGIVRVWTGDLIGGERDLAEAGSGAGPWRPLRVRLSALGYLAKAEYRLGRWDDSAAHAALAVELAEDSDHLWALSYLHSVATLVPAVRGDISGARAHVDAADRAAREGGALATDQVYAAHASAQLAFGRGDPAGVVAAFEPVIDLLGRSGYAEPGVMPWREMYAEALVDLGRSKEAAAILEDLERRSGEVSSPVTVAGIARVRAKLHEAGSEPQRATELLSAAAERLTTGDAPFELAQVDEAHGRLLRRTGGRRRAAELLGSACERYEALRALPFLERAERELAACGLTPRARRWSATPELTPREVSVSRLAGEGLTNREIATELIISVKTVEYHLSKVFSKLGIRSRRELRSRGVLDGSPRAHDQGYD